MVENGSRTKVCAAQVRQANALRGLLADLSANLDAKNARRATLGGQMNPYDYRWIVRIPRGYWMMGVHRFRLKKEADAFCQKWVNVCSPKKMSDIPMVEKNTRRNGKPMKQKLKLYVWTEFCPDYTGGLAFAIARDETQARKLIEKERGLKVWEWGTLTIYPIKPIAKCVSGGG
jgi:hypothetical protein